MHEDIDLFAWTPQGDPEPPTSRYRLVAVDLDGILLPSETLHPLDAASLRTAHAIGVKIVLASARAPLAIHRYWAQLGLGTPVIAFDGALVYDFPSHKHVLGQPLQAETVRSALEIARRAAPKAGIAVERGESWVVNQLGPTAKATIRHTGLWPAVASDLGTSLSEAVYELSFDAAADQLAGLETALAGLGLAQARLTNPDRLVLRSPAASLGWALSSLAGLLEVPANQVMAIGGNGRDRSMLQAAALAVLVSDMAKVLDPAATSAAEVAQSQGVAEALAQYLTPEGSGGDLWPSIER
jgi:hypothetical protein